MDPKYLTNHEIKSPSLSPGSLRGVRNLKKNTTFENISNSLSPGSLRGVRNLKKLRF